MVIITAAFEDRAKVVINHAPWFWPHQGTSSQEIVTMNGTTHTPKPELCGGVGGAGVRASLPQNGCTALDVRGLQMFESTSSGADAGPERSRNERSRAEVEEKMEKEARLLGAAASDERPP